MPLHLFTGTWTFDRKNSRLTWPSPQRWVQHVSAQEDRLRIVEEIARGNVTNTVEVDAAIDGTFYPVTGSPICDEIAYIAQGNTLAETGRKAGQNTFRKVTTVTENTMSSDFFLLLEDREIPIGSARFDKAQ